jgi:hypothetical protein
MEYRDGVQGGARGPDLGVSEVKRRELVPGPGLIGEGQKHRHVARNLSLQRQSSLVITPFPAARGRRS